MCLLSPNDLMSQQKKTAAYWQREFTLVLLITLIDSLNC